MVLEIQRKMSKHACLRLIVWNTVTYMYLTVKEKNFFPIRFPQIEDNIPQCNGQQQNWLPGCATPDGSSSAWRWMSFTQSTTGSNRNTATAVLKVTTEHVTIGVSYNLNYNSTIMDCDSFVMSPHSGDRR